MFFLVFKDLIQLGSNLIYKSNLVVPQSLSKNKKQDNSIFQNIFYNFLQIISVIFKEIVINDLRLKISVWNNKIDILKKKNSTGLVQNDK